jgi:F-box interacting protein
LIDITIAYNPYYKLNNIDCNDIVGSCNGLICLRGYSWTTKYEKAWFRLWNPATKKLSEMLGDITERLRFAFGYDNLTDTYKVVAFSANKVRVFSFTDNVWRDIQNFPVIPFDLQPRQQLNCRQYNNHCVYVSGTINWLAIINKIEYEWNDITVDRFVIVSLDLATETYRQLLPPSGFVEVPRVEPSVIVLMDCLCFSHRFKETHFVLWKMMEFGVQESWTQFLKISFYNLQIDYGISNSLAYDSQLFLLPLWSSESSNTLIMASNQEGYTGHDQHAILYNWRDNKVEEITCFYNDIMWFFTNNYFESMVSTCYK